MTGISREQVIWAYRTLLRRDPESEEVISAQRRNHNDRVDLILTVINSAEFISMQGPNN